MSELQRDLSLMNGCCVKCVDHFLREIEPRSMPELFEFYYGDKVYLYNVSGIWEDLGGAVHYFQYVESWTGEIFTQPWNGEIQDHINKNQIHEIHLNHVNIDVPALVIEGDFEGKGEIVTIVIDGNHRIQRSIDLWKDPIFLVVPEHIAKKYCLLEGGTVEECEKIKDRLSKESIDKMGGPERVQWILIQAQMKYMDMIGKKDD